MESMRIPRQAPEPEPELVPSGWLSFAGLLLIMVGSFNLIYGFAALFRQDVLAVTSAGLLVLNYTTWGWLLILVGLLQAGTGLGALAGQSWARVVGIILAVLSAIKHMVIMMAFPLWSLVAIAFDVMVIYGLTKPMEVYRPRSM